MKKKPETKIFEYIVPRRSKEEQTYATVKARCIVPSRLHHPDDFFLALRKAVTQWIRSTKEGKNLLSFSSYDLNIGDLAQDGGSETLNAELAKVGIFDLSIATNCCDYEHNWAYDDVLVEDDWDACGKCGSALRKKGLCKNETCFYSDHQQDETE